MRAGWTELNFSNTSEYTALASSATEGSLLAGFNEQPVIPQFYFDSPKAFGRSLRIFASGVLSTTGTPTLIFQLRLGMTVGASFISGTSIGVSAAITTQSGVTNKYWELTYDVMCRIPGLGTTNTTLGCSGKVLSPGGFASPFIYAMEPTTPDTGTWTATLDNSLNQYMNLSATWSASSASNTITCKQLSVLSMD